MDALKTKEFYFYKKYALLRVDDGMSRRRSNVIVLNASRELETTNDINVRRADESKIYNGPRKIDQKPLHHLYN